jgi:hypothetical protein
LARRETRIQQLFFVVYSFIKNLNKVGNDNLYHTLIQYTKTQSKCLSENLQRVNFLISSFCRNTCRVVLISNCTFTFTAGVTQNVLHVAKNLFPKAGITKCNRFWVPVWYKRGSPRQKTKIGHPDRHRNKCPYRNLFEPPRKGRKCDQTCIQKTRWSSEQQSAASHFFWKNKFLFLLQHYWPHITG